MTDYLAENRPHQHTIGGRFDDWCETDAERVEFLRRQNDLLRHSMIEKDRLITAMLQSLHELGAHEQADHFERLSEPF